MLPLLAQRLNINTTSLRLLYNSLRLPCNRHINHLPIQSPSTPPRSSRLLIRNNHPHRPLRLLRIRSENRICRLHLRRVDALLPIES